MQPVLGRILVVDHDPGIQESLTLLLVDEGYMVLVAPDGATGLELRETWQADLILLDMQMPGVEKPFALETLLQAITDSLIPHYDSHPVG
jgi:CheY-like chemotaxis protein